MSDYDASVLVVNKVIEQDLIKIPEKSKLCSEVIYYQQHYYKVYCEGSMTRRFEIRLWAFCEDATIEVQEVRLDSILLAEILRHLVIKDLIPSQKPLKHIRTFEEFCKICIFPFIVIEKTLHSCHLDSSDDSDFSEEEDRPKPQDVRCIDFWARTRLL